MPWSCSTSAARAAVLLTLLSAAASTACEDDTLDLLADSGSAPDAASVVYPDASTADATDVDAGGADARALEDAAAPDAVAPDEDAGARDALAAPDAEPVDSGCTSGTNHSALSTNDTSHLFTGTGPASAMGDLTLTSTGGQSLHLPVSTDGAGGWVIEVPLFCGQQTLVVTFPADPCYREEIDVLRGLCSTPDIQVTVTWDELGRDWELHLIEPGGHINDNATDCTWTSCIGGSPDWGVLGDPTDDPHKDVNNTGNFGPENIYLSRPVAGLYTVMVEHWGSGTADSDGQVTVILAGAQPVVIPIVDLASRFVRFTATIDWTTRTVTPLTTVHDCTANWSGGCRDLIP